MLLAGHTLGTPDQTVEEAIVLFREAGLDGAELILQDGYRAGLPVGDAAAADRARAAADAEGVRIVGLTPYTTGLNAADADARRAAIDEFRAAFDAAHRTGARTIRVYAGAWHDELDVPGADAAWARLADSLAILAPEAVEAGTVLCVENHFGTMTRTAAATARLVREVGHPGVAVLYDQANLAFTHDEDVDAAFAVQGDLIGHVHVKDLVFVDPDRPFVASETAKVKAEERAVRSRVIGDGVVPWARVLAELVTRGYDGALSIEYEYRWHPADLPEPRIGFAESAKRLRALVDAALAAAPASASAEEAAR